MRRAVEKKKETKGKNFIKKKKKMHVLVKKFLPCSGVQLYHSHSTGRGLLAFHCTKETKENF